MITPSTSERDIMLIRLAEMYLIKAECQMELGQNGEALNTLNYLRAQRAIPVRITLLAVLLLWRLSLMNVVWNF